MAAGCWPEVLRSPHAKARCTSVRETAFAKRTLNSLGTLKLPVPDRAKTGYAQMALTSKSNIVLDNVGLAPALSLKFYIVKEVERLNVAGRECVSTP